MTCIVRRGFSAARWRLPEGLEPVFDYRLEDAFAPLWERAAATGAAFILLLDDAIEVRPSDLALLQRILNVNSGLDGITLDSPALLSVYGAKPAARRPGAFPFTLDAAPALPSWFALLRAGRWNPLASATPEFFLLGQPGRNVARTGAPDLQFDAVLWAGDLILSNATGLASDYRRFAQPGVFVPPQFQVAEPGADWRDARAESREPAVFTILCPSIRPDFLREAVESVLDQTYPYWELRIAVDGPAPHNLARIRAILDDYRAEPRVHVVYQEHRGTGPARQALTDSAAGDYLIAMDDDDRLPRRALERIAAEIERASRPPLLRAGARTFGLFETTLSPRTRHMVGGVPNDIFEVNQPYAVRNDIFRRLGGFQWDDRLKSAGEDSDLFLKADRAGIPVRLIDEPLYERRLSTLNQTLDCGGEECLAHVRTLYGRHSPPRWTLDGVHFRDEGAMLAMITAHRPDGGGAQVVCGTRFMDFQKIGGRENVVLDLEITSLCNAVCEYCPRDHMKREARFMPLETVEAVATSLRNEGRRPRVVLCGVAESTLHPELDSIVRALASAGASVGMTTNGWNLSPELVDRLTACGLGQLNVSLNAVSAEKHEQTMRMRGFERIVEACREAARLRPRRWPQLQFHVSFVVTQSNFSDAVGFAEQWRESGVSQVWLHNMTNRAGLVDRRCASADMAPLISRFAGDPLVRVDLFREENGPANLCRVARGVDFLSVDGEMLLCAQDYEGRHKFGRITDGPLAQLHHGKILRHLRGETADTCSGCTFCPPSLRAGRAGLLPIVQSGGC